MGRVVGARPAEIAIANTLTIDLHLLLVSFFRRTAAGGDPRRRAAVPVRSPRGHQPPRGSRLDPAADLIVVEPATGEGPLRPTISSRDPRSRTRARRPCC
jgi:kynureninase